MPAVIVVIAAGTTLWIRRFHHYTPVEAVQDVRAAIQAKDAPQPVERFLELRYGPLTDPANRQRAFLDFFNIGHIKGLHYLAGRMGSQQRQASTAAMAQWVANYRTTMTPDERASLGAYVSSDAGRATIPTSRRAVPAAGRAVSGQHRFGHPGANDYCGYRPKALSRIDAVGRPLSPAPEPRLARELPTIPPLPFRRGEGRGEGSDLGFRGAKRVKMSGDSLPEGEGRGEGKFDVQLHRYG